MQTSTELYPTDFVIIQSNGDFYQFTDGEYIIFPERAEAERYCAKLTNAKVYSCTKLSKKNRKNLRQNIRKYGLPF